VDGLQSRIQNIVDHLLDAVQDRGTMDLIRDVAFPFPIDVLAEVMGAADQDKPMFRDWMRTLGVPLDPVISANDPGVEVRQAIADVRRYFSDLAADRRKRPREDLISIMVAAEGRGDLQTEEELVFSAMFTLLAGHETTMNMIGNGMLALFRNPAALARLQSDPALIDAALDEFLRFDSPVQVTFRTASEDVDLGRRTIPRGEHVVVFLGAANRDPERFPDPDKLDILRPDNHHLSFAAGPHRCIGEVLAKVEGRIAFETILRRMPRLALADRNPKWRPAMSLRGLQSLPMTF
jgi:cytochrome P450